MKLVMLETSPAGPLFERQALLKHKDIDFKFVTHNKPHDASVAFRHGENWISNRNFLAAYVPRRYDYYWFTDYDVVYQSQTNLDVVEQIIADLEEWNPAVMVCYDGSKRDYGEDTGQPRSFLMSNNQMKIIHHSLLTWFFPQHFWIQGQWENCHLQNVLEFPFRQHVMMTPNVHARGTVSHPASRPESNAVGIENMQKMHEWICPSFTSLMPHPGSRHEQYKTECLAINQKTVLQRSPADVQYGSGASKYFDLNHPQFSHWQPPKPQPPVIGEPFGH